ncbi:MAG: long-chain fatty acid--CoA ligase [Terriglobia bacterium]|jgi:long-chain acyl-CoA synthetase
MNCSDFTTLNELFLKAIEKYDKPDCLLYKSDGRYRGISSREALRKAAALASALERLGARPGERIALLSENRPEWTLTDYAILGMRAITVPLYPTLLEPDLEYILRDSEAKGIVLATDVQLRKVLNIWGRLPALKFVLAMDCSNVAGTGANCWEGSIESELGWSGPTLVEAFKAKALDARPGNTASLLYTSGTMGQPQGVILTHANLVSNILSTAEVFPLSQSDVLLSFLPLSHVFERMVEFFCFWKGVSIAYVESLDALPQNLLEVRPTVMAVVPRLLEKIQGRVMDAVRQAPASKRRLFHWAVKIGKQYAPFLLEGRTQPLGLRLKHALADRLICSRVREQLGGRVYILISGAAPLSKDLGEFFFALGLPVYEGYGLTETSPVISVNCPRRTKLGTVGPVIPRVEVKLSEEEIDPEGAVGREILVRGPNVTAGYYHLEEVNRAAFVDGWFRTGDLGAFDSDGYLKITGRKKNLFKTSGGKYVAPEKLENLFQGHPYVYQIAVLGDGRKFVGALIVPDFTRLMAYARSQGISFQNRQELVANPGIQALIRQQVDEATCWLPRHEKIRRFILLPQEFTIASGELSLTLKVKRRVVEEKYRAQIEEMFSHRAPQAQSPCASKS